MTNRRTRDAAALPSDDLGEFGEVSFLRLCAEAGIAANRVQRDKYGWDVLVEVPMVAARPHVGFGETDPAVRTCKVQVKTTQHGEPTAKIKLSNWAIMAREPYPWFIVQIGVDGRRVKSIRLGHVGKDLVESALKRVFLAERAGKALHKVAWRCSSKHLARIPSNGTGLLAALRAHLGKSASGYTAEKCAWRDNAGYDETRFIFSLQTTSEPGASSYAKLARLLTGEIATLTPAKISISERRFGVSSPIPMGPPGTAHSIQIPKPPSTGVTKVLLSRQSTGDFVELACQTYNATAAIRDLPREESRVRLVTDGFELLFVPDGDGKPSLTLRLAMPSSTEPVRLESLVKQARVFALLTSPEGSVELAVRGAGGGDFSTKIPTIDASIEHRRLAHVVKNVGCVCAAFDIPTDFDVLPGALLHDAIGWSMLGVAASNRPSDVQQLRFGGVSPAPGDVTGKRAAFLMLYRLPIGTTWVSAVICVEGMAQVMPDGAMGLDGIRMRIVAKYRSEGKPPPLEELGATCRDERERLLKEGFAFVAVPDTSDHRAGPSSDTPTEASEQRPELVHTRSDSVSSAIRTTSTKARRAKPPEDPHGPKSH